jgi:signal transducing adaptor molecule
LYDFEAVEENELTFKAGDVLIVFDDSDPNWWKGSNFKTEGLFPSNFVTSDLNAEIESFDINNKKVKFNEEVAVKNVPAKITIDEGRIDECLELIQNADPSGELQPDNEEFLQLEDSCYGMGPLIDQELQKIDQKHTMLEDLNMKLLEAFQMYHNLMKESLLKQPSSTHIPQFNSKPTYSLPQNLYQSGYNGHQYNELSSIPAQMSQFLDQNKQQITGNLTNNYPTDLQQQQQGLNINNYQSTPQFHQYNQPQFGQNNPSNLLPNQNIPNLVQSSSVSNINGHQMSNQ